MPNAPIPRMSHEIPDRLRAHFRRGTEQPDFEAALVERATSTFRFHRGWQVLQAFLQATLPAGRYALAGAVPAALVASLREGPVRVEAVLDAVRTGEVSGCPILSPASGVQSGRDVIVCQPAPAGGWFDTLRDAGFGSERILDLYRHPAFPAFHDAWVETDVLGPMLEAIQGTSPRVDHVILVPSGDLWMVVEEEALRRVLPPEHTIRLYYGPPGRMDTTGPYRTFDVGQCLPLAVRLLETLAPQNLYIRGSAQFRSEAFGAAVKALLPGLRTVFEVYDYALMLDDELTDSWGFAPETMAESRDAEVFLATRADLLIDKVPGPEWEAMASELLRVPRTAYAPALGRDVPALRPRAPGPLRVLCAGSMPYFKNYRPGEGFPGWAYPDIVGPLRVLAGMADCRVDLFNASHPPEADLWEAFQGYATLFDPERVAYHPRLPLPELLGRMPGYDFGLFLFSPSSVLVDYPLQQSLPNRCMSCIAGGLPLIVNTEMRYLASLVERFQAGITLACTEVDTLPERLRSADLQALREGVRALHQYLVTQNQGALEALAKALQP